MADSKENIILASSIIFLALVFSFVLFGFTGIKITFGILLVAFPFYLILGNFEIELSEKIVFSMLLGLTIFPSFVYILGFFISFKISIFIIFVILTGSAYLMGKLRSRTNG